jgi:hypothetical protein
MIYPRTTIADLRPGDIVDFEQQQPNTNFTNLICEIDNPTVSGIVCASIQTRRIPRRPWFDPCNAPIIPIPTLTVIDQRTDLHDSKIRSHTQWNFFHLRPPTFSDAHRQILFNPSGELFFFDTTLGLARVLSLQPGNQPGTTAEIILADVLQSDGPDAWPDRFRPVMQGNDLPLHAYGLALHNRTLALTLTR